MRRWWVSAESVPRAGEKTPHFSNQHPVLAGRLSRCKANCLQPRELDIPSLGLGGMGPGGVAEQGHCPEEQSAQNGSVSTASLTPETQAKGVHQARDFTLSDVTRLSPLQKNVSQAAAGNLLAKAPEQLRTSDCLPASPLGARWPRHCPLWALVNSALPVSQR